MNPISDPGSREHVIFPAGSPGPAVEYKGHVHHVLAQNLLISLLCNLYHASLAGDGSLLDSDMCRFDDFEGWGLHPLNELATLADVLGNFSYGEMEGCSSFLYPNDLQGQTCECYVAAAFSGSVLASAKVGEILLFGKYLST